MRDFIPAILLLVLLAAVVRDDTVLTMCYLLAAVYFVGGWWSRRAFSRVSFRRHFTQYAFPNEPVPVRLDVINESVLPIAWLSLYDSAVPEIAPAQSFREVISLGPHGRKQFQYQLRAYKRGYYAVGPLFLHSGDLFGMSGESMSQGAPDHLTVYPRVVPITRLGLPSRSPLGTLRHHQPIFEDPTRVIGKRDYTNGDSLRRVDWKSTAATGRLQVKQFEPSIALDTVVVLNLHDEGYNRRSRFDDTELAVVVAASIANYVTTLKQSVGLLTNAKDAVRPASAKEHPAIFVPSRKGRQHLIRILETLARVQTSEHAVPFPDLIQNQIAQLPWGTTLVLITGKPDELLFDSLFRARRAGMNAIAVLAGVSSGLSDFKRRAEQFGLVVHSVEREKDLNKWRV